MHDARVPGAVVVHPHCGLRRRRPEERPMKLKHWLSRNREKPWPVWNTSYLQTELIGGRSPGVDDPGGVCFRLAFKWLACQRTGSEFTFLRHRIQPGVRRKADKTIAKQNVYLAKVAPHERPQGAPRGPTSDAEYGNFHGPVDRESVNLLNLWGGKASKTGGAPKYGGMVFSSTEYTSFSNCRALASDISAVVGIYGRSEVGPWAHATAFHRRGTLVLYFDSNGGEFTLDPDDPPGDLIQADLERYAEPGDPDGYTIEHLHLYTAT
jgi:hypothetical protein